LSPCSLANIIGRGLRHLRHLSLSASSLLDHPAAVKILQDYVEALPCLRLTSLVYVPEDEIPKAGHLIHMMVSKSDGFLKRLELHCSSAAIVQQAWFCHSLTVSSVNSCHSGIHDIRGSDSIY
jgi:hypothetical protein